MTGPTRLALPVALPLAVLALAGCGGRASTALPATSDGRPATLGVSKTGLGDVLVNSHGHTLYVFQLDTGTTSECTGVCAVNWPPLRDKAKPVVGSGVKKSIVGTTLRGNGATQLTYNGHPLYTFENDGKPGDTNGEGIDAFGGSWFAISAAGTRVSPQAQPKGGYGY